MSRFPSLRITRDALTPLGAFAEAQAAFLSPDQHSVADLQAALRAGNIGVVAHFYMDPELQGVLTACDWPHIHISDSLVMADRAVQMAQAGVQAICVAGVDFMSENVRAVLDAAGHSAVPVYRLSPAPIGCSLAEAAESQAYLAFLRQAQATPNSLHVVYINTSLRTKALSQALVPTITCTSSNVVHTILTAAHQVPEVQLWYGPDTYMGENLRVVLRSLLELSPRAFAQLYPQYTQTEVAGVLRRFHPFLQGNCIVHHLFGSQVVAQVRQDYPQALLTAHLEVPGEMFALAADAQRQGRGVVGSTSNILDFLTATVRRMIGQGAAAVQVVLGTEAGMITSIVRSLQAELRAAGSDLAVEIVFPVAAEAIAQSGDASLPVVPGPQGGEGCSLAGGCATCPFMKMNSLDALLQVAAAIERKDTGRLARLAVQLDNALVSGQAVATLGAVPILHMRHFQRCGSLPPELVADIADRHLLAVAHGLP